MNGGTIVFLGGVHGVGKTTICTRICQEIGAKHLPAGDIIKQAAGKNRQVTVDGKRVADVTGNQDLLLSALSGLVASGRRYLLDGHFTLLRPDNVTTPIPLDTFKGIAPKVLILLTDTPEAISERLLARGGPHFELSVIVAMQDMEAKAAAAVASALSIPLLPIHQDTQGPRASDLMRELSFLKQALG